MASSDLVSTDLSEDGGALIVTVNRRMEFASLVDGEPTEAPVPIARLRIPAEYDVARAVQRELRSWCGEQVSSGPPSKPVHQQYADHVEPEP